jgi:PucR C-terminal helix-turn-helix domain
MGETRLSAQAVVDALSVAIRRPVVLDDPSLAPLAYSRQWGEIDGLRSDSILGRGVPEAVRAALMAQGISETADVLRTIADPALGMDERVCVPVRRDERLLGYIWLLDPDATLTDDDLDQVRSAARRVAPLLVQSADRSVADQTVLLQGLSSESREDRLAAAAQVRARGVLPSGPVVSCLLATTCDDLDPTEVARHAVRRLSVDHAIVGAVPGGAAMVVSPGDPVLRTLPSDEVARWLHRISPAGVAIGQSTPTALDGVHQGTRQARIALQVASAQPAARSFAAWSTLGADRLVAQLPGGWRDDIPAGLSGVLRERPVLAATLAAFLEAAGDVRSTAEATSLHRSGVYYRLRRIEELTGLRLDRGEDRLLAHLAIRAERLF